jgi:CYTH domain-containing protein
MTALDRTRQPIEKHRHCFVWKDQYFELDIFESPQLPCAVLEIELLSENQEVFLPPFLKVIREVSHDPAWKNSTIAKRVPTL